MPFATPWMDLERIMLSETSLMPYDFTHMWNLRNKTNKKKKKETKKKKTLKYRKQTGVCQKESEGGDW